MKSSGSSKSGASGFITRKAHAVKDLLAHELYHACSQSDFTWRYIANLKPWLAYQSAQPSLDPTQERMLAKLERDGAAITSVKEFFGDTNPFAELEATVGKLEGLLSGEIKKAREELDLPGRVKSYLIKLLGSHPVLDPNDIFARLALHPKVLAVVNSYFGMFAKLRHYNVWHNFPTQAEPQESQLWHRDPEDRCILKMFVYLTDVDEGAGPLSYAPGTHARGAVIADPQAHLMREGSGKTITRRTDDAQMRVIVPEERWITATGPKGTIVFVDTRGYHKGGLARQHDRIVYMCAFTSKASVLLEDLFERKLSIPSGTDKATAFAIEG